MSQGKCVPPPNLLEAIQPIGNLWVYLPDQALICELKQNGQRPSLITFSTIVRVLTWDVGYPWFKCPSTWVREGIWTRIFHCLNQWAMGHFDVGGRGPSVFPVWRCSTVAKLKTSLEQRDWILVLLPPQVSALTTSCSFIPMLTLSLSLWPNGSFIIKS